MTNYCGTFFTIKQLFSYQRINQWPVAPLTWRKCYNKQFLQSISDFPIIAFTFVLVYDNLYIILKSLFTMYLNNQYSHVTVNKLVNCILCNEKHCMFIILINYLFCSVPINQVFTTAPARGSYPDGMAEVLHTTGH